MPSRNIASIISVAALLCCADASAVDGVVLIDQNKALAGNVTPGDVPGFPVIISQAGSYRLSGNLTVPNSNTIGIELRASNVTIDLNGFSILGSVDCSGGLAPCAGAASFGYGIVTAGFRANVTISNGTIVGMGSFGIRLDGDGHRVKGVTLVSNGGGGVVINSSADARGSVVENSIAQRNGGEGIFIQRGTANYNDVSVNIAGIFIGRGSARNNFVNRHVGDGLRMLVGSYIGNVFLENDGDNVSGGINMGQNLCDNAPCPNAQY